MRKPSSPGPTGSPPRLHWSVRRQRPCTPYICCFEPLPKVVRSRSQDQHPSRAPAKAPAAKVNWDPTSAGVTTTAPWLEIAARITLPNAPRPVWATANSLASTAMPQAATATSHARNTATAATTTTPSAR
eukprot:scaffold1839_cov382-Prasinococcus_capsulatus_cf.AAC.40